LVKVLEWEKAVVVNLLRAPKFLDDPEVVLLVMSTSQESLLELPAIGIGASLSESTPSVWL
jgi:hypothetical protein